MARRGDVTPRRSGIGRAVVELLDVRVDRLVSDVQEEGRVRFPLALDEGHGTIGQDVRQVALDDADLAVLVELRIGAAALTRNGDPVVETRAGSRVVAHVPLAEERRLVAGSLQLLGKGLQPVTGPGARDVVDNAVAGRELTGEDRRTVRRAEWHGVKRIREHRPFRRQPIDVRSLEVRVASDTQLVPPQVVHDDHDDVGTSARQFGRCRRGGPARRDD